MDEYIKARVSVIYGMQVVEPHEDASQATDLRYKNNSTLDTRRPV